MKLFHRIANLFSHSKVDREIRDELQSHIEMRTEANLEQGMSYAAARREALLKFGNPVVMQERVAGTDLALGVDSFAKDVRYAWRMLWKRKVTTFAAVLSLGLAMGSCVAAFRLVDALFFRPMPIMHPERVYVLANAVSGKDGKRYSNDGFAYPDFERMRDAVAGNADLLAASNIVRSDLTYASDEEMEKGYVQYVSGKMFAVFGLQPTLGRLLTEQDDQVAGESPVAVLSYDCWQRRFSGDPSVVGRNFRLGSRLYTIVGVGSKGFTGTEPGTVTDYFLPAAMHRAAKETGVQWLRVLAVSRPATAIEPLRAKLEAAHQNFEQERVGALPEPFRAMFERDAHQPVLLQRAGSGVSDMQADYRSALEWLEVLVAMVLLIACANVANLVNAQAQARAREMALRVAIGAGRGRLVRLVLVESMMLAGLAGALGVAMAWWSAPLVTSAISTPNSPARLVLNPDWRVTAFSLGLLAVVAMLFGLAPALQSSRVRPATTLKGGEEPPARQRWTHGMVALQAAFCMMVLFVAGLFVTSFREVKHRNLGFDPNNLLLLETAAPHGLTPEVWAQMGESLRSMPGVVDVAESSSPMLSTVSWNSTVRVNGGTRSEDVAHMLAVSPHWFATMRMRIDAGREFRASDAAGTAAIVNESFVKHYLQGRSPLGSNVAKGNDKTAAEIVGVVADAPYRYLTEPDRPVLFLPYRELDAQGAEAKKSSGTFAVRTAGGNPMALAMELRKKIAQAGLGLRVSNAETQQDLMDRQTVRERLLAMLGAFFAVVAVLLAAVGLYGVLHYSVLQREREIGIRIALGAAAANIARIVAARVLLLVGLGIAAGLVLGRASERYVASLLYGVKATDPAMMLLPCIVVLCAAVCAAAPVLVRAVRIDPAIMLRAE